MKRCGYDVEDYAFEDFVTEMRRFQCGDGMCGQLDCVKCYPQLSEMNEGEALEVM